MASRKKVATRKFQSCRKNLTNSCRKPQVSSAYSNFSMSVPRKNNLLSLPQSPISVPPSPIIMPYRWRTLFCVRRIPMHGYPYTERKTDPKSRYFAMFQSTFEKCLIQLSVELIQLDIVYDSLNYTEYRVESALPRVESNIFRKLIQTSENMWIWGLFFFQCTYCNFSKK